MRFLLLLLLVVVLQVVQSRPSDGVKPLPRKRLVHGRPVGGLLPLPTEDDPTKISKAAMQDWIMQKVDNFDPSNQNMWRQRYWYNQQWYKPGGPVFLMIGGESAGSSSWVSVQSLYFVKMAMEYGALAVHLEHRYYGESHPTSDMSTANMKWLSSEQALADIAAFIPAMNTKFNLNSPKWVTFGGSYSGAMSGWFRQKYPQLVVGAIATSGPVFAEVDFKEYLDVVQTSLATYSQACADNTRQGFTQIQNLMQTAQGRATLKQKLRLCQDINMNNQNDVMYFYESIMSSYMVIVQYSQDNVGIFANDLTVPQLCAKMNSNKDILDRVADVNSMVMAAYGESCVYISYNGFIQFIQNTQFNVDSSDDRSWIYQTCTEFGYYQSTDMANNIFGQELPVSYYVQECAQIYGSQFTPAYVNAAIAKTNAYYGGRGFNATNVVLPNGSVDPWHALGILQSPNNMSPALFIQGTAHCADMYPARASDPRGLTNARQAIDLNLGVWLRR